MFFLTVVTFIALFTSLDAGERTTCFNGVYSTPVKPYIKTLNLRNTIIITRPRMGPSLGFVTDVFFCRRAMEHITVCSTVREIPNSGGRHSHCFTSSAIVRSKELRQVKVEFASPLVGVHPVTFAEQNQEREEEFRRKVV